MTSGVRAFSPAPLRLAVRRSGVTLKRDPRTDRQQGQAEGLTPWPRPKRDPHPPTASGVRPPDPYGRMYLLNQANL